MEDIQRIPIYAVDEHNQRESGGSDSLYTWGQDTLSFGRCCEKNGIDISGVVDEESSKSHGPGKRRMQDSTIWITSCFSVVLL